MRTSTPVQSMGWTRHAAAESIRTVMEEHRKAAGQRLAKIRDAAGLGQEELAHRASLSTKTISRFENGQHDGRRSTVNKIAAALDVKVEDILGPPPAPLGLSDAPSQLDRIEEKLDAVIALLADPEDELIDGAAADLSARQDETDAADTAPPSDAKPATPRARRARKRSA